jgi:phosphoribosyl 1,2-cyclic phosphodiesterase
VRDNLFVYVGLAAALLTFSGVTFAHHGSVVSYDTNKMITVEGTVTEFRWRNPHVYVMYDVKDAEGNIVNFVLNGKVIIDDTGRGAQVGQ